MCVCVCVCVYVCVNERGKYCANLIEIKEIYFETLNDYNTAVTVVKSYRIDS